jgi:hypothetical protein
MRLTFARWLCRACRGSRDLQPGEPPKGGRRHPPGSAPYVLRVPAPKREERRKEELVANHQGDTAEISNDTGTCKALIAVGNSSQVDRRQVRLYDDLTLPNGSITAVGIRLRAT